MFQYDDPFVNSNDQIHVAWVALGPAQPSFFTKRKNLSRGIDTTRFIKCFIVFESSVFLGLFFP